MAQDKFLSSDELRQLTRAGSSFMQAKKLEQLGIPYKADVYGTPMVERRALSGYLSHHLQSFYEKLNLNGGGDSPGNQQPRSD